MNLTATATATKELPKTEPAPATKKTQATGLAIPSFSAPEALQKNALYLGRKISATFQGLFALASKIYFVSMKAINDGLCNIGPVSNKPYFEKNSAFFSLKAREQDKTINEKFEELFGSMAAKKAETKKTAAKVEEEQKTEEKATADADTDVTDKPKAE